MDEVKQIASGIITMLKMQDKEDLLEDLINELRNEMQIQARKVILESAVELSKNEVDSLKNMVVSQLGFQPVLVQKIDRGLLGGVRLRIGDTVIDVSLKRRLNELKKHFN